MVYVLPSTVLINNNLSHRFPQVNLTNCAFVLWFAGCVIIQQRICGRCFFTKKKMYNLNS